ncbi:DUF4062 domain-containing protein [Flavobacterium sp. LC2016-12]|uniref:DUF4062 domain-containing protein n=1 Tax=Flavobacterium sp. LC2016-12 TaxID=2783794 RepID=UPI00188BEF22|nr:DUF4062 domain-containing protein [Flavobacterium sp. LC2016-12]MBF4465951.1 DUF4062 domain-containing protein [Flavobacterium sp. LC2016-12]
MKKKYQIFVSSTYTDLIDERQSAVQAILRAGHIPAGMELFSAGDKTQLEIIKKWIQESDIYVLILGGRYGSIEAESQLAYTEIEYRYAIELGKPFFSLIMEDELLNAKTKQFGPSVLELENQNKYQEFKKTVKSKVCRFFNNSTEIKLSVLESIMDIQSQSQLVGWIRSDEIQDNSQLLNLIEDLKNEKEDLMEEVKKLEALTKKTKHNNQIGEYTYEEIKNVLIKKKVVVPASLNTTGKDVELEMINLFYKYRGLLTTGVTNFLSNPTQIYICNTLVPTLLNFNLVERISHKKNTTYETNKFFISALGNKFLSLFELEKVK